MPLWSADPSARRTLADLALDWTRIVYDHHSKIHDLGASTSLYANLLLDGRFQDGLFVDGARMPIYLAIEWRCIASIWPLVLTATAAVVVGTALGTRVLGRLPQKLFRRVIGVLLIALGLYMAVAARG